MQNRGEQNVHFKMYKDGKRWVTRGLALGAVGLMVVAPIATTNLQLTHVKNVVAATTDRSLTQNEQAQIDRLQSVIDGYRFVQELAGTDAVWQGNLSGAISKAMDMIQTIKSGDYTQANGSYSDGMPFADQQIQFQVDRVEDYALAIEVAYIREHNADWYAKVTRGEVFPDITTDYLNSLASGAQDGFQWMKHYLLEIVNGYLNETGKTTVGGADKLVTSDKPATSSAADNGTTSSTTNSGSSSSDEQAAGNGSSTGSNSSSAVDNGTASSTTNSGSSSSDEQAAGNGSTGSNSSAVDNGTTSSTTNPGSSSDDQTAGNGSSTGSNSSSAVDNGSASSTTDPGSSSDEQAAGNGSTGSTSSSADNGTTSSTANSSSVASSAVNEQVAGSESATANSSAVDNGAASSMTNSSSVASSAATVRVAGNDSMNVVVNTPASVAPSATTGAVMNLASTATTNASTNNATTNANVVNGVSTVNNQTSASAASAATVASSAPVSGSNVNRINDTVESTTPQALKLHASDDRQFDTLERSHVTETFLSVIIALIAALMYKMLRNNKRDEADDVLAEEDERLFSDVKKISKIKK